jgi:hypothetical protein
MKESCVKANPISLVVVGPYDGSKRSYFQVQEQ